MVLPKISTVCCLLVASVVCCSAAATSASVVDCGGRPIRLAFYEFGYFYFDAGQGIDVDVVNELVRRTTCKIDTQVMTRARIWADLASGDLDMSVSGIRNPERDRFAGFAYYLSMKNYALVHRSRADSVRRAEDFVAHKTLQFGVVRGFKHGDVQDQWLEQLRLQQRVQESADVETVFRKLKDRRIDAMFAQPPVYRRNMALLGLQDALLVQDWAPGSRGVPHGLILSRARFAPDEVANWQRVLDDMRRDGTLRRIYSRYLPDDEVSRMLDY